MIITQKGNTNSSEILIEQNFRAPREKVFKAWTKPESLKKWFMADEGVIVNNAAVDLQVGGSYFIETIFPGYDPSKIEGSFQLINTPSSLQYSWITPILNGRFTQVNVEFLEAEKESIIKLSHKTFLNENEMKLHLEGWRGCLNKLTQFLEI